MTIFGSGTGSTILDGNGTDRVIDIHAGSQVTLAGLVIQNGAPGTAAGGGGIRNSGFTLAHLTLTESLVRDNIATNGAGLLNQGVGAQVDIVDSTLTGNIATAGGGGVYNNGIMTVVGSTFDNNQARSGGGVDFRGGSLHMTNTTISGNSVTDNGGGIHNAFGIFLTNVTLVDNTAQGNGGGIFNNEANAYPKNTIIAMNQASDGNCSNSEFANVVSQGHNLADDSTCNLSATGDMDNQDPLLGPLQDHGGPTLTRALLAGSPAIDKADDAGCPSTDQRGVARPQGSACDIGAYELIPGISKKNYLPISLK